MLPCFIYALLVEAGIDVVAKAIAAAMLSKQTWSNTVAGGAPSYLCITTDEICIAKSPFLTVFKEDKMSHDSSPCHGHVLNLSQW